MSEKLARFQQALAALRACLEREARQYGEQLVELGRLAGEAPAPDPCGEAFNELVAAVLAYDGDRETLDLGEFREAVYRRLS